MPPPSTCTRPAPACATPLSHGSTISPFAAAPSASAASGIVGTWLSALHHTLTPRARAAFIACKRSGGCTAHVWAFAANLEWRINRCYDVARQLFDVGMKQFSSELDFVLQYAAFASFKSSAHIAQVRPVLRRYWLRRRCSHSIRGRRRQVSSAFLRVFAVVSCCIDQIGLEAGGVAISLGLISCVRALSHELAAHARRVAPQTSFRQP